MLGEFIVHVLSLNNSHAVNNPYIMLQKLVYACT